MDPIFNKNGRTVGWLESEERIIYDLNGNPLAFLDGDDVEEDGQENIINYQGKHKGLLDKGYFRDHSGAVVAFLEDAENMDSDGPLLPIPDIAPIPPIPAIPPVPPVPPVPPIPGISLISWSNINWESF